LARFDRYLLSQFMILFGFFSLVLVMVYWVNRAVVLFDQLIANGQSAVVFLEFTALTLPNVIRIVLPVAAFAAVVYVTNRLQSESELVVVQATGYSPARLARAVIIFGLIVAACVSILTHFLVPASIGRLSEKRVEIRENITARLLTEGEFLHPLAGITIYIREVTPDGELRSIFLNDSRKADRRTTYTARSAVIVREDGGPKILMFEGMAQTLNLSTRQLSTTRFKDFVFDIGALIPEFSGDRRVLEQISTLELLRPTEALLAETGRTRAQVLFEGHDRISQSLLAVVAPVLGFSILMLGSFSRFGMWRQIFGAIVALVLVEGLDNAVSGAARTDERLWMLTYVSAVAGLVAAAIILHFAGRTRRSRTRPALAEAPA
jgi:lipopolysaccharide export system permease protein